MEHHLRYNGPSIKALCGWLVLSCGLLVLDYGLLVLGCGRPILAIGYRFWPWMGVVLDYWVLVCLWLCLWVGFDFVGGGADLGFGFSRWLCREWVLGCWLPLMVAVG